MSLVDATIYATHLVFAGLWSGTVLFTSYAVLPAALNGDLRAGALEAMTGKLRTVSRASALLLLLTGGHLAATIYTAESLFATGRGHLVLTMVALWFTLAALVEVGAAKLVDGTEQQKVRQPAADARPFLLGASLVAVLLLVDAGAILGLYY
ncbi:transporter [Haloarcula sp. S1CR25-12]|uniref:Transporter n=1 Tax=Haloarcula saliterrae TaxID=2950534 RepID=A0ABU2F9D6_9EURY|nr:transporter [Haloarcula sp. S1CR25-12]MDS0258898.1 transporter [Haloarcula sp. S1CR25-12]